jgi:hypothetical protein
VTLDAAMLAKARAAAEELAEAERSFTRARDEYHSTIRRLHLVGATFREIADAFGISHQRVKQLVDAAGGTWWQRVWRDRRVRPDAVCAFCRRPRIAVRSLISGPGVHICERCIADAQRILDGGDDQAGSLARERGRRATCSFCSQRRRPTRELVRGGDAIVCGDCLILSRQILEDLSP